MKLIIASIFCVCLVVSVPISDSEFQERILEVRKKSIGKPNSVVGDRVANYTRESGGYPEELGTYYEGDILTVPDKKRNGITYLNARWPNGVVPYVIAGSFSFADMTIINNAFSAYRKNTCIRFVPRTNQRDYISIESGRSGCWSFIGRIGGRQTVNLQNPGCVWIDTVVHELMHAVGFFHEQSRTDRDRFIRILWQNISPGTERNFAIATGTSPYQVSYDYRSVMHYSAKAFSRNGQDTIQSLTPGVTFGNRVGLTASDTLKIRRLYRC